MKIAISGKGGVGKTLLSALLSKIFAESGYSVLAIDADPDANVYGGDSLFPRRGRTVVPGSLVDLVIKMRKPHLAQHITLLDGFDEDGLVAIARPQMISGILAKVALVVLLEQNRDLLLPQIERSKPTIVDGFHRHL